MPREHGLSRLGPSEEVPMAKRHSRPSAQYRYEHYDPIVAAEPQPG